METSEITDSDDPNLERMRVAHAVSTVQPSMIGGAGARSAIGWTWPMW
jgi:hypothetical protein